jgi:AraC family transcriptional regulator of adaptative response/methylated-DNA-[protein]-cysteine methyltransferase
VDKGYERIRTAIIHIVDKAASRPTLNEVAAHVGLGPCHFQRPFRRREGVSLKRLLQRVAAGATG